jgi:hypothetical protein
MIDKGDLFRQIRSAADKKLLFLPHAVKQMLRPERMITTKEVRRIFAEGDIIEDYPEDPRGHSCLIFGRGDDNRPIHIVCAPKENYLAVITAYVPDAREWTENFTKRVEK